MSAERRGGGPGPASPWGVHPLRGAGELDLTVGPLRLRFREEAEEIRLHRTWEGAGPREAGEPAWTRWATADWDGSVALTPAFPDRPVVVEPEDGFHLLRGASARVYVRVPLWVHLEALGAEGRATLARIATTPGSDTWWGSVEEGELCYWLPTSARRRVDDSLFAPHLAMCPLHLVNRSSDDLPVEKVALRVSYLSLYEWNGQIWADETRVRYHGEAEGSQLDMAGAPPPEAPDARLLASPRLRMGRGFRARTFARLRSLHGWI